MTNLFSDGQVPDDIASSQIAFLGSHSSFETRCETAFNKLSKHTIAQKHFLSGLDLTGTEVSEFRSRLGLVVEEVSSLDRNDPLSAHAELRKRIGNLLSSGEAFTKIIDISTFRKEEVLVVVSTIYELTEVPENLFLCYTPAADFGQWLSIGVDNVRPVVGYPGEIFSSKRSHLIILTGIEYDRAIAFIEAYEPSKISLGLSPRAESFSEETHKKNQELTDYLERNYQAVSSIFEFSAKDPISVALTLSNLCDANRDYNTIIAPINTKLSTIGCGVFALKNPKVQLCYAPVNFYNTESYSLPGEHLTYVRVSDLFAVPVGQT